MAEDVILTVDGAVERPLHLTFGDLRAIDPGEQVEDVSRFHPQRRGAGVILESVLRRAGVRPTARYLTLHAAADDFAASIPLAAARAEGIVVYRLEGRPLDPSQGGPVRFLIRNPAACHTDELDDCANVKYVDRIELSIERGRDTRPTTDAEHEGLHSGH